MGPHELPRPRRVLTAAALALGLLLPAPARAATSFIPIPEIVTDPNEGTTAGLLAVILFLDEEDKVRYMLAPDASYNENRGFFPVVRLFGYPKPTRRFSVVAGKSTTKDETYQFEFHELGLWDERVFVTAAALYERDSTERFFGFGNDSDENQESNYTGANTRAEISPGVWLLPHVNLAYRMRIRRLEVQRGQVDAFPFVGREFPDVPGLDPAHYWAHQVALAYDSRDDTDIPHEGALLRGYTEVADRVIGSTTSFVKFGAEWRQFVPIYEGNPVLAMRAGLDYVSGSGDTPFWERSDLGGKRSLRAFGGDRFIDFNRSLAGAELRTRVYERRIFGVKAEIEVAPFLEAGEVFERVDESPVSDPHVAYGVGFRGVVRPQIVGFVDLGHGSEGVAIFTGVNYPF